MLSPDNEEHFAVPLDAMLLAQADPQLADAAVKHPKATLEALEHAAYPAQARASARGPLAHAPGARRAPAAPWRAATLVLAPRTALPATFAAHAGRARRPSPPCPLPPPAPPPTPRRPSWRPTPAATR
jgi:hypothetical protein